MFVRVVGIVGIVEGEMDDNILKIISIIGSQYSAYEADIVKDAFNEYLIRSQGNIKADKMPSRAIEEISFQDLLHEIRLINDDAQYEVFTALKIIREKYPNGIKITE